MEVENTNLRNVKGFKDYLPTDAKRRRFVVAKLSEVFERYGFEPLETPTLEYASTLEGKYGAEEKLIYKFETEGNDKVAMKYDQTVPLARVVSQYGPRGDQLLTIPFKRFQIQSAFRGENTQKGRYREFLQCDVDIVGVDSPLADGEILTVAIESYKALGLSVTLEINDRELLKKYDNKTLAIVDKLKKIGQNGVVESLITSGMSEQEASATLDEITNLKPSDRINNVITIMEKLGYSGDLISFTPTLIRGLDYYTGIILEVVLKNDSSSSSLGGGGRWNEMIGKFCGLDMPAVGFAVGVDRTIEAMVEAGLFDEKNSGKDVLVTVFNPDLEAKSIEVWNKLQSKGINAEIWLDPSSKLDKQLKYADSKNKGYVIIIGQDEISDGKVTLKRMADGESSRVTIDEVVKTLSQ